MNIETLKQIGNYWTQGEMERVYFEIQPEAFGWEVTRYKTGKISGAKLNGEKIANGKATSALMDLAGAKFYYDIKKGEFAHTGLTDDQFTIMTASIKA